MTRAKQVVAVGGNRTIYETEGGEASINPTTVATQKAGATVLPIGTLVTYTLGVAGPLATATDFCLVALSGDSSSKLYAVAFAPSVIASSFIMPVAEKLDVNVSNQDSAAHWVSYTWQGTSP
jgi:hypothetical protein